MEGTCHGPGKIEDFDKGAPTYFRYLIDKTGTGQDSHPGSAHAVLYSLQKIEGRFCDFKTYTDTEVLVAMTDVMEWIETVLNEIDGTRRSPYDTQYSKIDLNFESMKITTTSRTTALVKTTTDFQQVWGNYFNYSTIEETEKANPGFKFYFGRRSKIVKTKPPIIYLENYDMD